MNKCFKYLNKTDQWATPKKLYDILIKLYHFEDFNPLCEKYENSLEKEFNCNLYCNPPYSNITPFVDYMIEHNKKGYKAIMLLPSRTGTKWFKKLWDYGCEFRFYQYRLKFGEKNSAPFDCFLCVINGEKSTINFIEKGNLI